jgi:hypothetical protein
MRSRDKKQPISRLIRPAASAMISVGIPVHDRCPNGAAAARMSAMSASSVRLSVAGRTLLDGAAMPGTPLVAGPGEPARCLFRGPCDELHLYASNDLVAECAGNLGHAMPTASALPSSPACLG